MAKETRFLRKQTVELQKKMQRETLAKFRKRLRELAQRRRDALKRARELCRASRVRFRERRKEIRAGHREAAKRQIEHERADIRGTCEARKLAVRSASTSATQSVRRPQAEERRMQRELGELERRRRKATRTTARERAQETDQAVEQNLAPELAGVWRQVKARFRVAPGRKSRTEAFLEWAEENPEEVMMMQAASSEEMTARDIAELRKVERKLARRRPGAGYTLPELYALRQVGVDPFEAVPF